MPSAELNKSKIMAATETVNGHKVKDINFLQIPGFYAGKVEIDGKFVPTGWDKRGKCKNKFRSDLDLKLA